MVDEIATPTPAAAASVANPPTEAAASFAPSAAVSPSTVEGAEAVTVVDIAPKADAPKEIIPVDTKPETLLGGEKKATDAPDETKPEESPTEKPVEPAEGEPPPLPTYEPFTLPENVAFDTEKMGEFTKSLGEFEALTKSSHEEVQKFGQQLLDRHLAEMQRYTESLTQAWEKQRNDWKEAFLKDPEFTNRTDTAVNSAIDAISVYGGDSKQQQEFRDLMESTGVGNHPAIIRLLSNVMVAKAEPKPLAAPQIATPKTASKIERMYGKKAG